MDEDAATGGEEVRIGRGDVLELPVDKAVYRGWGLAHDDGLAVMVRGAWPGERVRARVIEVGRGFLKTEIERIVTPSAGRRASPCPVSEACGGCAYLTADAATQLRMKEEVLRDAIGRAGVDWDAPIPVTASPEEGWRTRAQLHPTRGRGPVRLGFFEERSRRVVATPYCRQLSEPLNETLRAIEQGLQQTGAIARRVSDVLLVESRQPGAEQVVVLQGRLGTSDIPQLVRICAGATRLTGVLAHLRDAQGQTSLVTLQGSPYVHHTIGSSLRLRAHARSFFQANRFLLDDLVAAVSAEVPPDADVLDLYAGVGLFAIAAADRARSIRAAELDALATEDARENAHQRLCDKITFESLDVLAALTAWPTKRAETIILDPPRAGAGAAVIDAILARHPEKIIAVACDPPTLGRDLARLISGGYALRSLRLLDLFPGTFHLETIAVLTPAAA